ncbi:MAG TPA: hypothetical protein VGM64_15515 [Lacunisphaera sp.]
MLLTNPDATIASGFDHVASSGQCLTGERPSKKSGLAALTNIVSVAGEGSSYIRQGSFAEVSPARRRDLY